MLPSIKNRFYTQNVHENTKIREKSLPLKSKSIQYSKIKAKLPYIEELKYASIQYLPQKYQSKSRKRTLTNIGRDKQAMQSLSSQYIPQQISSDQINFNSFNTIKQLKKYKMKKGMKAKINHILKVLSIQNSNRQQNQRFISPIKQEKALRYIQIEDEFLKLTKNKLKWTYSIIQDFISALNQINPFFKKIKEVVSLCLLKIGTIKMFNQNQIMQKQDDPMMSFAIILWGEILLKNKDSKMRIYLFPGDSLNQQLIFPNIDKKSYDKIYSKKGHQAIKQTGKTKTNAGVLYLKVDEYKSIFQQLVKIGQKSSILIVQNMMKWSLSKKKGLRKQFSHL